MALVTGYTSGLTSQEAAEKLKANGFNELQSDKKIFALSFLGQIFREPMFLLLVACATLYFFIGDKDEALILLSFVFVVMGITYYQEQRSEHALNALRNLSSPRAFVIRDRQGKRVAGREVVCNDIIVVSEGDCVPADAVLLSCDHLLVDEAILTGESLPVQKYLNDNNAAEKSQNCSVIYSGTHVIQGKGVAKVIATGAQTEMGKIGKSLMNIKTERTALQKETDHLVRNFAIYGFALSLIVALIYGFLHNDLGEGFLVGITLAMAIVPEEFPVVLAVFLALGAWRISLKNVLTRHAPAIEALGAATVLCVDKTGTITQNQMSVSQIYASDKYFEINQSCEQLPEEFHQLFEYSMLANQRDPFDPMEIAIKKLGEQYLEHSEHIHEDWQLIHQYPLSKELLAISLVWQSKKDKDYIIAAKGSPEAIIDLCHLNTDQIKEIFIKIREMADKGLRVLGVAKAKFRNEALPAQQHDFDFEFLGLIGLADPVRSNVLNSIKKCYTAGVRVIMITGDYTGTAQNIGKQIELDNTEQFITGPELALMDDLELEAKIKTVNIFARILPEQKLRIVNALKANDEIVAMTGDGVNDASALKAAHIGIAMGGRGTDVARESASLVLLNDDFSSIVTAVRLGRRIFDNIKKVTTYLLSVHIPIIGMSLVPVLLKWPLMLLPIHILFLQLVIDPTCSIVFEAEAEDADIMNRPPRKKGRLFSRDTVKHSILQGMSAFAMTFVVLIIAKYCKLGEQEIRAIIFTSLVASNLAMIFINLSSRSIYTVLNSKNPALWWIIGSAPSILLLILYNPFLCKLFHFNALNFGYFALSFVLGVMSVIPIPLYNAHVVALRDSGSVM
ncbi:Cation_ATPase_N domain-containing protein [Alphaproteobacteria bacterium]